MTDKGKVIAKLGKKKNSKEVLGRDSKCKGNKWNGGTEVVLKFKGEG